MTYAPTESRKTIPHTYTEQAEGAHVEIRRSISFKHTAPACYYYLPKLSSLSGQTTLATMIIVSGSVHVMIVDDGKGCYFVYTDTPLTVSPTLLLHRPSS